MPRPALRENRAVPALRRLPRERRLLKAGAVPAFTIGSRPESKGPASPVQLLPKTGQRLDLLCRLTDPLVEHPEQAVTRGGAVPLPGRHDQLANRIEREAERLGLPDEGEPAKVDVTIQAVPARAASRWRQDPSPLIEPQRPDREAGATGDFTDRHQVRQVSIAAIRHCLHAKASTRGESQALDSIVADEPDISGRASVRSGERP